MHFGHYEIEYSKEGGVKQVTFITIFIRIVVLFWMTNAVVGQDSILPTPGGIDVVACRVIPQFAH
jgi:hypothetical protein